MESGDPAGCGGRTAAVWQVELAVAGLLMLVAVVVIADSFRIGIGWSHEGPQAGFFPFYVGLILLGASVVTFVANLLPALRDRDGFVDRAALRQVLVVLIPAVLFVAATGWLGIYLASALLILFFMRVHGGYGFPAAVGTSVAAALVLFAVFELWFLVPLPKGPFETALGY
jgi:hypothetical protein